MAKTKTKAPAAKQLLPQIDFTEVPFESDLWELFARDFLVERGFAIETPPDRGADQGKDILVTEQLTGKLNNYRMRWLVSCKHFAKSGKSVSEEHEPSVTERMGSFQADGFIGFYSTLASAGFNTRLMNLRRNNKIKDYQIFDHRLIEHEMVTVGYSHLMMRYFPESYGRIRPLHTLDGVYRPLPCATCGKDLLMDMFEMKSGAVIVTWTKLDSSDGKNHIEKVYCVCKGECDKFQQAGMLGKKCVDAWWDLRDLIIPAEFMRYLLATLRRSHDGDDVYKEEAYRAEVQALWAIAQKVLRPTSERELARIDEVRTAAR